jgi:NADPH2:quinone reductase
MTVPSTTKAITFAKTGGIDVLELTPNHPVPEAAPTEIVVKVAYAGVNFFDVHIRYVRQALLVGSSLIRASTGVYPTANLPGVIGSEIAGTIVRLPTDQAALNHPEYKKRGFAVGSRVAAVHVAFVPIPPVVSLMGARSFSWARTSSTSPCLGRASCPCPRRSRWQPPPPCMRGA